MVKLIVIFFVVIFSAISMLTKKSKEAEAARRNMDTQGQRRPMYPEPPVVEDFDAEFRFLYDDDVVAEAQDNEPFDAHEEGESVTNAMANEPEPEIVAMEAMADDEDDCEAEIERWRRSVVDAEILKTKF